MASDFLSGLVVSVLLHVLVLGLIGFTWDSDPALKRAPEVPPFVQAVVMEKPAAKAPAPKPEPKPKPKPKPKPRPEPERKPPAQAKPAPEPSPPRLEWAQPDMEAILADEELAMEQAPEEAATETATSETEDAQAGEEARQIASYEQAIIASITSRWIIPATARARESLLARVRVHVLPGGEVVDVALVQSSGDRAFDDSVRAAVRAAAPLPVPTGALFHENFRVMTIEFNPTMKDQ